MVEAIEARYLTVKQAAMYIGFKPRTLYLWVKDGKMQYIKKGRNVRFDKNVLDRFMSKDVIRIGKEI